MCEIKLSICINTRNRAALLKQQLTSITKQLTNDVEVVVLDACSSDKTSEVVTYFEKETNGRVRYIYQDHNNGIDKDFDNTVIAATGEYCWLISDDDHIKNGALSTVLEKIQINDADLFIVNAEVRDSELKKVLDSSMVKTNKIRYGRGEINEFLIDIGHYLSFIGGVIIKRSLWLSRNREKYFGTYFVHLGVIFQKDIPNYFYVIKEPLVAIRYGVASWTDRSFEIWMVKWPKLIWSFDLLEDSAKDHIVPKNPLFNIKRLLISRALGTYNIAKYNKFIVKEKLGMLKKFTCFLISKTPILIMNKLAIMYYKLFKDINRDAAVSSMLFDLENVIIK